MLVIDGPSFSLGLALALPIYLVLDHVVIPWLVDILNRRHGGV